MDPVTIALCAAGLVVFGVIVAFFLKGDESKENAEEYKEEVRKAEKKVQENTQELKKHKEILEDYKRNLDEHKNRLSESEERTERLEKELRFQEEKLEKKLEELEDELPKWKEEYKRAIGISDISGVYTIQNALKLTVIIMQSFILPGFLSNPLKAKEEVYIRSSELNEDAERTIAEIDDWLKNNPVVPDVPDN